MASHAGVEFDKIGKEMLKGKIVEFYSKDIGLMYLFLINIVWLTIGIKFKQSLSGKRAPTPSKNEIFWKPDLFTNIFSLLTALLPFYLFIWTLFDVGTTDSIR